MMEKSLRFIQCGDLHLGSPFRRLPELSDRWRQIVGNAPLKAFQKIVQIAVEKDVHALFVCGDIYTGAEHNLAAQLDYVRQLHTLAQHKIAVFMVAGNHDPLNLWKAEIPFPPNVHVFSAAAPERVPLLVDGVEAAAVYGQSYGQREVRENLARRFKRGADDRYAIALLHTQVDGGDSPYAPSSLADLTATGMDYWALGHVHKEAVLQQDPYVVYAGNPQGLDRTETGPRGCYYVEVGPYGSAKLQFIDTSVVRWQEAEIAIDELYSTAQLREAVRHLKEDLRRSFGKPVFLNLTFTGAGQLYSVLNDGDAVRYWLDAWQEEEKGKYAFVMIDRLHNRTRPPLNSSERSRLPDMLGDYLRAADTLSQLPDGERLDKLREILAQRPEFDRLGEYGRNLGDARILGAFERAKWLGMERLMAGKKGTGQ